MYLFIYLFFCRFFIWQDKDTDNTNQSSVLFLFVYLFIDSFADSSSDDDSVFDEEQLRGFQRGGGARDSGASSSSYSDHGQGASPYHHASSTPQGGAGGERPRSQHYANYAIPGNTARHALADVMQNAQNARHCECLNRIPDSDTYVCVV